MSDPKTVADLISDPVSCQRLIGTKTVVKMDKKSNLSGYLSAVDPVAGILILKDDSGCHLVMPYHIQSLEFDSSDCIRIDPIESKEKEVSTKVYSEDELEARRSKLLKIINDAQLTVTVLSDGTIEVASVAKIKPPFTIKDVVSTNSIILERIIELIQD